MTGTRITWMLVGIILGAGIVTITAGGAPIIDNQESPEPPDYSTLCYSDGIVVYAEDGQGHEPVDIDDHDMDTSDCDAIGTVDWTDGEDR